MNVQDAVARIQVLQREMNDAANAATLNAAEYDAHMKMYNVACLRGDAKEIESERDKLHTFLDGILDAGFAINSKQREINEITRNVTD